MVRSKAKPANPRPTGLRVEVPLYNALGCAVRIEDSHLTEAEQTEVRRIWSGARSSLGDPLPASHLTVPVPEGSFDDAMSSLSQKVTLAAIEARRGHLWMLHAAGIADEDGRVIAMIAPSGTGKTTASRWLSSSYGYVTDETVGVAPDGTVVPYRKPLSVIETTRWVKAQRSPEELGLLPLPPQPLRLAAIVLLDRREDGPETPILETCDLGDVLEELVAQTSYIGDMAAPLRTIAALVSAVGGVRRVVYREASGLNEALAPLFQNPESVSIHEPLLASQPASDGLGICRSAYLDAISLSDPDRLALLQPEPDGGTTYRLLSGIGPALWRAADGVSHDVLERAAEVAYGTPEGVDTKAIVDAAVNDLTEQYVLATEPSWRIREDVAVTGETGRFVALALSDLTTPAPLAMEGSAATIWERLAISRGITATQLITQVASSAGFSPDEVRADVLAFLNSLADHALAECYLP